MAAQHGFAQQNLPMTVRTSDWHSRSPQTFDMDRANEPGANHSSRVTLDS